MTLFRSPLLALVGTPLSSLDGPSTSLPCFAFFHAFILFVLQHILLAQTTFPALDMSLPPVIFPEMESHACNIKT